jgi:hypothetical protein
MWTDPWNWLYILVALAAVMMFLSGRFRGVIYEFWDHVTPSVFKWGWVYLLIGGVFYLMMNGTFERIIHAIRGA